MTRYAIVGNGVAGVSAAERIRSVDKSGSITIISEEKHAFYYRPRLPEIISAEATREQITIRKPEWYRNERIEMRYGARATRVNSDTRTLLLEDGASVQYDKLLLATGAGPFVPDLPGMNSPGIRSFRSLDDVSDLLNTLGTKKGIAILGAGLLSLEVGHHLLKLGAEVQVVEIMSCLLPRQLDTDAASILQHELESSGFAFHLGTTLEEVRETATGLQLTAADTTQIDTDILLVCAGIVPRVDLAVGAGIEVHRGILVDDTMRTSVPGISAAGDAAEHNSPARGLWQVARQQGFAAGANMAGLDEKYSSVGNTTTLKVTGIDLVSSGTIADDDLESLVLRGNNAYRKLLLEQNRAVGCILLGDVSNKNSILKCVTERTDISRHKHRILDPGFDGWADLFGS